MQPASSSAVISECHGKDWIFLSSCKEPANVTIGEIWGYVTDGFYTIHDFVSSSDGVKGWQDGATYHRYYGNLQNKSSNRRVQTHYLINAAYLRVKNITLGYTLPKSIVSKIGLSNAKVYCSGENLFTVSSAPSGFDPERLSWGYPYYRTISFGFNLTL